MKKSKILLISFIIAIVILPMMATIVNATSVTYSTHTSQSHTKLQIKEQYENTLTYDYSKSMYNVEPLYAAPYRAGSLKDGVVQDTLRRINFYRWLYGVEPVTINTDKMERSQKGAVIQSANEKLSHTPDKPAGMDDEFYKEAYAGCNIGSKTGDTYSGNCSMGDLYMYEAIDGYISDIYNVGSGVGHRLSLLYPYAKRTSFGYCNTYTALSMYYEFADTREDLPEDFYAYPTAGYFPLEQFYTQESWHLYVTDSVSINSIQFTYNGKTYDAVNVGSESPSYPVIYFRMPDELVNLLGGGTTEYGMPIEMPECSIDVLIKANKLNSSDEIIYKYTVNFFDLNKVLTNIELSKSKTSIIEGKTEKLTLKLTPTNAVVDGVAQWKSDDMQVATVDNNGTITAVSQGTANITVTLEGHTATCQVTVTEKPPFMLGDVTEDGKINTDDARAVLLYYMKKQEFTETQKSAADVTKDTKINTDDARQILLYYMKKITQF